MEQIRAKRDNNLNGFIIKASQIIRKKLNF